MDAWVLSESGVGPIRLGLHVDDLVDELGADWAPDTVHCTGLSEHASADGSYYVGFTGTNGLVTAVQLRSPSSKPGEVGPRTAAGLGIGSTKAEILAAASNATAESPEHLPGTEIVSVPGSVTTQFVFFEGMTHAGTVILSASTTPRENLCG